MEPLQTITGEWYGIPNDTAYVTFDSLMTVEYKRGITQTTYSVNGATLTIDKTVMWFCDADYLMTFGADSVIITGPMSMTLYR
jgi:hypothetical protein